MAQDVAAKEVAQGVGAVARTATERELLKFEKKLREVEKLIQRRDAGETLDTLQSKKLETGDELQKTVEGLREKVEDEKAAAIIQEKAAKEAPPAKPVTKEVSFSDDNAAGARAAAREPSRKMFDARCLEGDWLDNFDQRIMVQPGFSRRSRTGGMITYTYKASVYKAGQLDRFLTVSYDSDKKDWRCGNGVLNRESSTWDELMWSAPATGRITRWERAPPDGPIYFDAPPAALNQQYQQDYYDYGADFSASQGGYMQGGDEWYGQEWPQEVAESFSLVPIDEHHSWGGEGPVYDQSLWSALVAEDSTTPAAGSKSASAASLPEVTLPEPSTELRVSANRLDWDVSETWGKLRAMPMQSHVVSPVFDVQGSPGMQLEFYPNGKKSTEAGFCTLQLVRAPESKVGIKFELCMNGRSNGPKACLGRRFLADYQKPFDDSDDTDSQKVSVSFMILSTF